MKKIHAVFLTLLSFVLCFTSCGTTHYEKYTSLISDSVNDQYSVNAEIDFWTGTYFEKKNMADKTCTVLGKSYTGSYSKSIIDKMNSYTTDIYLDENGIEFGLRHDTGELAYINFMNAEFFNTQPYLPEVNHPDESAVSLATEIAAEYIGDVRAYTQMIDEPVTRYKERDGITYEITYYIVTFAKKINGYFSSDYIAVKVTSKGTLASIMTGDIHAFDDIAIDFEATAVNQSISKKIESTYTNSKFQVKKSNIDDQRIVLTPNGDICLCSDIVVEGTDASNVETKTGISILTVLGKKQK